jgi:hypothetical protein
MEQPMIWPWTEIARLRRDNVELRMFHRIVHGEAKAHEARAEVLAGLVLAGRQLNTNLIERIITMKKEGFQVGLAAVHVDPPTPLPPKVQEALLIADEPGLEDAVRIWLADGAEVDQVYERIINGGVPL